MANLFRYTALWTRQDGSTAYWTASFSDHLLRSEREVRDHLKGALAKGHPHFVGAEAPEIVMGLTQLSALKHSTPQPAVIEAARGRAC